MKLSTINGREPLGGVVHYYLGHYYRTAEFHGALVTQSIGTHGGSLYYGLSNSKIGSCDCPVNLMMNESFCTNFGQLSG
jgi:hypothetical protein